MNDNTQTRKMPVYFILFAALAAALLLPLRLWQQMRLVEQKTGFWSQTDITVTLLYIGLVLLAVLPAIAALATRKRAVLELTKRRRVAEGVFAVLAAAALAWDAFVAVSFAVRLFTGGTTGDAFLDGPEFRNSSPMQYYIRSGAMACVLEGVFGILGALFFGNLALMDFLPDKKIYLGRGMALAPFAWVVCRILRRFSRTIAYLRVSDLFLGLMMLAALMLFLLAFAQLVSSVHGEKKASMLFAAGLPAAVLALVCFIPRFVVYTVQGFEAPQDALQEWCDPALALFIIAFIAGRVGFAGKTIKTEESPLKKEEAGSEELELCVEEEEE